MLAGRRSTFAREIATTTQPTLISYGSHDLFVGLDRRTLSHLFDSLVVIDVAAGDSPGRQGEVAPEFVVVLAGRIGVSLDGPPLAVLDAGSHFGALPPLDDRPTPYRRAPFNVLEPCRVAVASRFQFADILVSYPLFAERIRTIADVRRAYLTGRSDAATSPGVAVPGSSRCTSSRLAEPSTIRTESPENRRPAPADPGTVGSPDRRRYVMSEFTRRRFIAAAPASGLAAGAALTVGPNPVSAAVSGVVELITPFRLQDSRVNEPDKYDTTAQDSLAVPGIAGRSGVILNVTVTETEGAGFFRIADGFEPVPTTSNINWYGDDQTLANMAIVMVAAPANGIAVQGGGNGRAHLVIDVLGFVA